MTDLLAPDGGIVRRIFGLVAGRDQSIELAEFRGSLQANSGGSPAITQSSRWGAGPLTQPAVASGQAPSFYSEKNNFYLESESSNAYTVRVGVNPLGAVTPESQVFASERRLPVIAKTLAQQGVLFSTELAQFDVFARPRQVMRSSVGSSGGDFMRTETSTFYDDRTRWILGQVASVADGAGRLISSTEYDSATALPLRNYKFGLLQESITYNADGTVATVRDARNKTTTVSDWYRGLPRKIKLADQSTLEAVVNPSGTVASSKDAMGYTTSYGYDLGDRLARIGYPTGDTRAWNDTLRSFVPVAAGDVVPVGYWKQVTSTGNGSSTTYYDAQWRPVLPCPQDPGDASSRSSVLQKLDAMGRSTFVSYPTSAALCMGAGVLDHNSFDAWASRRCAQVSELGLLTA